MSMDWNMARVGKAEKAKELLEQASRLVFEARLELAQAGTGPVVAESLKEAAEAVTRAAGMASAVAPAVAAW